MPIIEIPGLGNIEFPEAMSHDEINDAIKNNIMPTIRATQPSATSVGVPNVAPTPSAVDPNALIPQSFEGVASEKPETNIADAIKNYLVKPVAQAFGTYDESAKHPYITSTATGLINAKNAYHDKMITDLTQLIEAKKEQYGPNFESAPKDEFKTIQQTQKDIQSHLNDKAQNIEDIKATEEKYSKAVPTLSKKLDTLEATPIYQKADGFKKLQLLGKEIVNNPSDIPEYVSHVGLESLPTSLPMMVGAAVSAFVGGPSAAMMTGGGISAFTEFGNEYVQLRQQGVSNEEATAQAATKSGVIGYFDALSFGSAGKALDKIMENAGKGMLQIAKSTTKEVGKETGKQALLGGSGEFIGSVVSGQPVNPRSVLEEAIGEVAGAPMEAVTTYKGNVKEAQQAQELKDLKDKLTGMSEEKPADTKVPPKTEETTPPTAKEPRTVTQEQLMNHATTRFTELDAKANGVPAKETVDDNGNTITAPEVPAQPMTEQEASEYKFLKEQMGNPQGLAKGYGVSIGEAKAVGSHDTEAALGELEGKEMPVSPIFQQPAKPAEPEVTATPETPPVKEGAPEETKTPTEETQGAILTDNKGKEHPLPTIEDAKKIGLDYTPINPDKPMYAKTDLDGIMSMINSLFKDIDRPHLTSTNLSVTADQNKVLPKTNNKNQISVTFRPNTLSGVDQGNNQFVSYDTAHKAIESFTIHNPGLLKVRGQNAVDGASLLDKFFTKGDNPDGSITYTLRRVKSEAEKVKDNEKISQDYLEYINRKRGKLTYNYKRLRRPGLNPFQESLNKYETLGEAFKDLLARLEKAIANNEYEVLFKDMNSKEQVESYSGTDPALRNLSRKQVEMYIDIIKHLMKIDPVMKTHLFMDPYIVGGKKHTIAGFYNRVTNTVALFGNTDMTTFVHEAVHAATVHYIKTHPNDAKVKQLEQILKASRAKDIKVKGDWKNYGNTDLMEFIAEAFSNPLFMRHLMNINPIFDKTEATSLFDNIKNIVRGLMKDVFGITKVDKTAFDEVMDLSDQMFIGKTLEGYKYDLGHQLDAESAKKQIESEPFKKWFGKSKIVNPDGTPKVMYHGTKQDINEFKSDFQLRKEKNQDYGQRLTTAYGLGGIYFTPDPSYANRYAKTDFRKTKEQANVIPVYLRMENPYIYPSGIWADLREKFLNPIDSLLYSRAVRKNIKEKGFPDAENIKSMQISRHGYMFTRINEINKLKAKGYDGIISPDGNMFIVFDGSQVKSAIGNKGTYSLDSNIITESQRPLTEEEANNEEESRQIFNYRGDPIDIRKWEIPEQGPIATKLSKWFQEFADEHVIISKVQKAIKALNRTISDMSDAEKKQELKNSRISSQLLQFANEEVNPILKEMIEKGVSMEDINKYLHARHAEAYNNRMNELNHKVDAEGNIIPYALKDRASGMSTQEANDYLNELSEERENILKDIANKWYAIKDKTQQILVESGQETQETIDLWNEIFPDYVPLNREQEQQAVPSGLRTGVGIDTRGNFSKRAMGSEKQVSSIVDALLYQRERSVSRAENNEVGKSIYRLALENPNPDFWLPINPDAIRSREKLIQELTDMGYANAEEIADNIMAEPKERYLRPVRESDFVIDPTTGLPIPNSKEVVDARISRNARFGDNVLTLKINGRERYIFFNQKDPNAITMVRALKNLDTQTVGAYLRFNRTMNHYFSQLYTVLNPIFSIKNGFRDLVFAQAALSTTPIRGKQLEVDKKVFPAMIGIMSVLRKERASDGSVNSEWQRIYKEALDAGFQTSNRYGVLNIGEEDSYIQQTLNSYKDGNTKKALKYIINMTRDFASMIENAMRLAAYQQMRETIDPETNQPYSPQKSASVAKNLTINFDKKGSKSGPLRAQFMFFNATIRGDVRLAEVLRGPAAKKIIAGGILVGVIQALMMAAAGFKDDDPPEYIKERNIIVPTGDGKYITLPLLPYGLNILPNFGRLATEYGVEVAKHSKKSLAEGFAKAHGGKKALQFANAFFGSFSPFGNQGLSLQGIIPSMYEIPASLYMNKNSFGQTISKQDSYTRPTPGYMRTKESGSSPGKEVARWLNLLFGGTDYTKGGWSPTGDDIDFISSSVTGPVIGSAAKTVKYGKAKIEGEEVPAYQVPIAGNFMGETDSKPVITSRFYNNLNAMYEHELTLKNIKGDPVATQKYIQENPDARAYKRAEHVEAQINGLNAKKKKFTMRGAPKEALQRIDNQKIIIMNRFNDQLESIRNQ